MLTKSLCLIALFVLVVPSLFASAELPAKTKTFHDKTKAYNAMIQAKSNATAQVAKLRSKEIHLNSSRTIQQRQDEVVKKAFNQWNETKIAAEQANNTYTEKEIQYKKLEKEYMDLVAAEKAAIEAKKAEKAALKATPKVAKADTTAAPTTNAETSTLGAAGTTAGAQ
ncbi:hypothetical protein Ddc_11390 [Ditylenchus destructor]|nr:hypothetical protein Ddc_11390 [Ditylenchus destructor]